MNAMHSDMPRWTIEKEVDQVRFLDPLPNETGVQISKEKQKMYTYEWFDDNSFIFKQSTPTRNYDKWIKFGPLESTLYDLMVDGFELMIEGRKRKINHSFAIKLVRKKEIYSIGRVGGEIFNQDFDDIGSLVKNVSKPSFISGFRVKDKIYLNIKDPLDALIKAYPRKTKSIEMIGNQTLTEYVKTQLKKQRSTI